ncbi:glycoside/pentoside/hexuronide transporter [Prevotella dentalis DSM 3688]|uniref:GPH family glycoside-pentoside-hexuronide:cation symporter n=1 Tax=Prevotella dentalis (strain ATCC 49559 / DSM 3688 / JCM 13448 / NCTC 12043 / ES 2772) TaxID=908937 RepID=F9D679_PREDD|nr:MFS transporter [Prevotella dentalis]AGB29446.1 glycoside/pentoside/hexuronide transporter [Prevotella dentalis DSM 3688]EGQ12474.1 GPH family glycoside-pentoside-hexuronide:cation symporter [Prevotella dentalis DSM 3688]
MATIKEKIGYGMGDMASSMFWKVFSYYLPIFYSDIFGLTLAQTASLMFVTRVWDAVSDPMMGVIADRTETRWGKYRPYLLWFAAPFAIAGVLLFTTPDLGQNGKLIWAYCTYILMMTVYTGINVPYASMLGVMTTDSYEKTVFSSYRMFFAYAGSFVALFAWEPLCDFFVKHQPLSPVNAPADAWQGAMIAIAAVCFLLFIGCFMLTREHVRVDGVAALGSDFKALLRNVPWWILTAAALCTNLFNTVRGATVAYYFKYYIGEHAHVDLGFTGFVFFAGLFLAVGEVCNMLGVVVAVPLSKRLGKKSTFILAAAAMAVLSVLFFMVPLTNGGYILMLALQVAVSVFTGIVSPLVWSMYADVADYSQARNGTASTGLVFSSGSMAQKFGGAIAGSAVLLLFDAFGLVPNAASQTDTAILGMRLAMSCIPAAIALLMCALLFCYPLDRRRMQEIGARLVRSQNGGSRQPD